MFKTNPKTDPVPGNYYCKYCWTIEFFLNDNYNFCLWQWRHDLTLSFTVSSFVRFNNINYYKSSVWFFTDLFDSFYLLHLLTSETGKYFILTFRVCCLCRVNIEFKKSRSQSGFCYLARYRCL